MSNPKPIQFEARVYSTLTDRTYVSLSWRNKGKLLSQKVTFEKTNEAKEVELSDGKELIVSFGNQRKEKVRVSLVKDFMVTPCIVTLKEKESSPSL